MLLTPTRDRPDVQIDVSERPGLTRRDFVRGIAGTTAGGFLHVLTSQAPAQERAREKQPALHPLVEQWLREKHPTITRETISKLEDDLDNDEFDARENAEMELKKIPVHPVPYLRRTGKSVEQCKRLGKIHEFHDHFGGCVPPIKGDGLLVLEAIGTSTQNEITFDSATEKEIKKKLATMHVDVKPGATFFSFLADVCEQAGIGYEHKPWSVRLTLEKFHPSLRPAAEKGSYAVFLKEVDGIPVLSVQTEPRVWTPGQIACAKLSPATEPFKPEEGRTVRVPTLERIERRGMLPLTEHVIAAPLGVPYKIDMIVDLRPRNIGDGTGRKRTTLTFSMPALAAKEEMKKSDPMR